MKNRYRVLRVIEYVGDRDAIIKCLEQSIQGVKHIAEHKNHGAYSICTANITGYPELLEGGSDEENG